MREVPAPPAVVVGVDGSRAAIRAALWAVDEAVSRDIPLRLVYALDPGEDNDVHPDDAARRLATAEIAVRSAVTAVESTDKPVTIEVEITQGHATSTLVRASRSAVMVCVGAVGLNHFQRGRVGSTAAALASSANCPVAIIRGHDRPAGRLADGIIVETDAGPRDGVVLEAAMEEARLRKTQLTVISCWQSQFTDIHDAGGVADGNRRVGAQLDRRLARWTRRYPDLAVKSVVVHGSTMNYLAKNPDSVQLVVVGAHDCHHVEELVGPTGNAALRDTDSSLLIVNRRHL
jgi:nucleotide-binding universal stress UspA family protein